MKNIGKSIKGFLEKIGLIKDKGIFAKIKALFAKATKKETGTVKVSVNVGVFKEITIWDFAKTWLPMAVVITLLCGIIYVVAQQTIRLGANDQIASIASDTANVIEKGSTPPEGLSPEFVDLATSASPFIMVYDGTGKAIYSTGAVNGQIPNIPSGVFKSAKDHGGESRFTWQPAKGIRLAVVLKAHNGVSPGFVLAGKSLREPERLIQSIGFDVIVGLTSSLLVTFLLTLFIEVVTKVSTKKAKIVELEHHKN